MSEFPENLLNEYQIKILRCIKDGIRNMNGGKINEGAKIGGIINEAEDDNLVTVAKEIQEILEQLSKHYPTKTRKNKMILTGEAIEIIEENTPLIKKIGRAVKAGSLSAIESLLNHPAASFCISAFKDLKDDD